MYGTRRASHTASFLRLAGASAPASLVFPLVIVPLVALALATGCGRSQPDSGKGDQRAESGSGEQPKGSSGGRQSAKASGKSAPRRPAIPELTSEQVARLIRLKEQSIARLESGPRQVEIDGKKVNGLVLAINDLEAIRKTLPGARLPLQNLAIGRTVLLMTTDPRHTPREKLEAMREEALAATKRWEEAYPGLAESAWLRATILLTSRSLATERSAKTQAQQVIEEALRAHPRNAHLWYLLYEVLKKPGDKSLRVRAREAIGKAAELLPDNIYLLSEKIYASAYDNVPIDPADLRKLRELVSPFAERIRLLNRVDVTAIIDRGLSDPKQARIAALQVRQPVLKDEISQTDRRHAQPHPLDFVVYEFEAASLRREFGDTQASSSNVYLVAQPSPLAKASSVVDLFLADFDQDGRVDLWILEDARLRILGGDADPAKWKPLVELDLPPGMRGIAAADLDRDRNPKVRALQTQFGLELPAHVAAVDSDIDVLLYGKAGCLVFRNDLDESTGKRSLVPVQQELGLQDLRDVDEAILVDLDHDYDLDLVTSTPRGTSLWLSMGPFRYANIDRYSQLPGDGRPLHSMAIVDIDRDVDIDIVAVDSQGNAGYLENLLHARFRWQPFNRLSQNSGLQATRPRFGNDAASYDRGSKKLSQNSGPQATRPSFGSGAASYDRGFKKPFPERGGVRAVTVAETDSNPSWEIVLSDRETVWLWRTATHDRVLRLIEELPAKATGRKLAAADLDNDGLPDLLVDDGKQLRILHGRGKHGFEAWDSLVEDLPGGAWEVEDLDHDGDLDLVVATDDGIRWWRNEGGSNHYLRVHLVGTSDNAGRCNKYGIGSLVELRTASGYQAQVAQRPVVHFGLGSTDKVDVLRVVWTNGVPQAEVDLAGNLVIREEMSLKGSCPYIYTWTGDHFAFFTDCLWAAPLGLQVAEGVTAPARPWEYLKIPGDRIVPRDGAYELLLTEELWEAGYFDQVRLLAVDHPPGVDIYSNEKVGPAEIAEFRIHTVGQPRLPRAVRDSQGRDCLERLRRADGEFVQAFPHRIRRGLAPEHFIEIDLGPHARDDDIKLFLTGWIFPTDTSLNIAFAQDPELNGPVLPRVMVPDQAGKWQTVIPYMGFPGGKTKTIVVDLTGKFLTDDFRVRIVTSAELYWDRVFYTLNERPVDVVVTEQPLVEAELFERGFSAPLKHSPIAPRRYDGRRVSRQPHWPPMRGPFTRTGDVRELLLQADDRMAVIGAGDAIRCRFAQTPVRPGWERDFLLHSVGWDKDADLNTLYGQSTEPLPFRGMPSYPYAPSAAFPDSPSHGEYRRVYQQRQSFPQAFWRLENWIETN